MLISVPARAGLWEPLAEQIMALQALWISLLLDGGCLCERLIISGTANEEQMKISTTMVEMEQHISVPCPRVASLSCSARHSRIYQARAKRSHSCLLCRQQCEFYF